MDVYTNSSGLQHVVGYGPHSVVVAHHNHGSGGHHHHHHSLPPRPVQKATSSYQLVSLVPVAPTTIYVPVEAQQKHHHHQQPQGNYFEYVVYIVI